MLEYTFFGRCTEFIVGIGLAVAMNRFSRGINNTTRYTTIGLLSILIIILILVFINVQLTPAEPGTSTAFLIVVLFALPFPISVFFWGLINEKTLISNFLSSPLLQLLGKSSCVLYLIHLGPFDTAFTQFVTSNFLIKIIVYTLFSVMLYKLVEHPIHLRLKANK